MTDEVAHSGSFLGTATTTHLDEGGNLYWTETRFSETNIRFTIAFVERSNKFFANNDCGR